MKENPLEDGLLRRYLLGEFSQEEVNEPLERYLQGRFSQERMEELIRRYLLEEFSEEEMDELGLHLSMNNELFDLAEAMEADLLAAVDRGEFVPGERKRILKRLASSPQGRERLALARALNTTADKVLRESQANVVRFPRWKPVASWAAALAACLVAAIAIRSTFSPPDPGYSSPIPEEMVSGEVLETPSPIPPEKNNKRPITPPEPTTRDHVASQEERPAPKLAQALGKVTIELILTAPRGDEEGGQSPAKRIKLADDVGFVELKLGLEGLENLESFNVALRNRENIEVWQQSGLKPQPQDPGSALVFTVPADQLASGWYEIQAQGVAAGEEPEELAPLEIEIEKNGRK